MKGRHEMVEDVLRAVGQPSRVRRRAEELVAANPGAEPKELAVIIQDEIDAALSDFYWRGP